MERLNLTSRRHHAVTSAHNLPRPMIDNHVHQRRFFHVDRHSITWRRVLDVSDRVLRNIIVGLGSARMASSGRRLRHHGRLRGDGGARAVHLAAGHAPPLGRIVIGNTTDGKPITADDLHAAGAMTVIMREAIKPNLLQTLENTPVLVHAGTFGNSPTALVGDRGPHRHPRGRLPGHEAGFGANGAERFFQHQVAALGPRTSAVMCFGLEGAFREFQVVAGRLCRGDITRRTPRGLRGAPKLRKQVRTSASMA